MCFFCLELCYAVIDAFVHHVYMINNHKKDAVYFVINQQMLQARTLTLKVNKYLNIKEFKEHNVVYNRTNLII